MKLSCCLLICAILSGCGHSVASTELEGQKKAAQAARTTVAKPLDMVVTSTSRGVILPTSMAPGVLEQCSRETLGAPDSFWLPKRSDIEALEARLPAFLKKIEGLPQYKRQYAGFIRQGRKTIYVNLFAAQDDLNWRQSVVIVCDGGRGFFGVEFDVGSQMFIHAAFNGIA